MLNEHSITLDTAKMLLYTAFGYSDTATEHILGNMVGFNMLINDGVWYTPAGVSSVPDLYAPVFNAMFPYYLAASTPTHTWADFAVSPDGTLEVVPRKSFDETTVPIVFPDGVEASTDRDYYWMQRGECPVCRDGSNPVVMPGGFFECKQCHWRNV